MTGAAYHARMLRFGFVLVAALAASACGSYRRVAPLSTEERAEMSALHDSLAGRRVVVPGASRGVDGVVPAEALARIGVVVVPGDQPVDADSGTVEFVPFAHCMNGLIVTGVTLGVLPYPYPGTSWGCRFLAPDGRVHEARFDADDGGLLGWIGLPLALLPGRSAFFFGGADDAQKDAICDRLALFVGRELVKPPDSSPTN